MMTTNFIDDTFEFPARNGKSLLKIKIPATIQFFKNPSRIGRVEKVLTPPITVGGGANYVGPYKSVALLSLNIDIKRIFLNWSLRLGLGSLQRAL